MKRSALRLLLGLCIVLGTAGAAQAAGFGIYEWGARGLALGGAMTARVDDPSAVVYNPAALTQVEGLQVLTGMSFIMPGASVTTRNPYGAGSVTKNADDKVWPVPHFYASYQLSDDVTLGLGAFTRYGLGNSYDQTWWGRYNTYHTALSSVSISPTVAWKVNNKLSLGFGLEVIRMDVSMKQAIDTTRIVYGALGVPAGVAYLTALGLPLTTNDPTTRALDISQELEGSGYGVGGNIGLHYKINDQWKVGFSYRSRMTTFINGEAQYKVPAQVQGQLAPITAAAPTLFRKTDVSSSITTPDSFNFGVEFKPMENLSIEVGAIYTLWSTYDELKVDFDNPSLGVTSSTTKKEWNDTIRVMGGVEYLPLEWLALRCGYVYDQSPIQKGYEDYALPANDRHLFNFGLGFMFDDFTVDVAYTYLHMLGRDVAARLDDGIMAGSFQDGRAHMVALSVGYKF